MTDTHFISATFFGIVQQTCPNETIPELKEIEECLTDSDCEPRICCPETLKNGTTLGYCRTPQPIWETIPIPKDVVDRKFKTYNSKWLVD